MMDVIYAFLTALGSGAVSWVFSRKVTLSQIKSTDIDNAVKNAQYYQDLVDDLANRLKQALEELHEATLTITNQNKTIQELSDIKNELIMELNKYKKQNN